MRALLLALLLLFPFAASAIDYLPYYGKDAVREGTGGTLDQVEGVDIWKNGDPPRQYEIIGFIEDTRLASGLIGMARTKSLPKQVAKLAREHGGDAVILVESADGVRSFVTGSSATAYGNTASGSGWARPVMERSTRFAVIRYLPDAPPAPAEPAPTADPSANP